MRKILIIGAASAIAERYARIEATRGARFVLVGRDAARLQAIAEDLLVRGAAAAQVELLDVDQLDRHAIAIDAAHRLLGGIDVALVAHGTLPDQAACDADTAQALAAFTTNAVATISLMNLLARVFETQAAGTLAVVSSVAGDRGRASNALYGSAKAAVSTYASGLRQRFGRSKVNVLTIKPGFVDTPMTRDFRKGPLWASPEQVATGIARAIDRRRSVAYLPWFWWPLMRVITHLPESVFRRIRL